MKKYKIWNLDYFDETIEENNTAYSTLTKKHAEWQEIISNHEVWINGYSYLIIEDILKQIWSKEDVDEFIKENIEVSKYTFFVYNDKGHTKYCPLSEIRDLIISNILENENFK